MKKFPLTGGVGKEYINALNMLYSTPCDTPTITTAQPHRLPPYGRQLLNLRPTPADELRIYFGAAKDVWNHARVRNIYTPPALVLPPSSRAQEFRWPVDSWPIFAIQLGDFPIDEIPVLARLLLENGASIVRALYGENPDLATFRPVYREAEQ